MQTFTNTHTTMWLSMQMLPEFSALWKLTDSYSAAGWYNFICVQKILTTSFSFQWCCPVRLQFLPSGFLISLLPQDKQFTEWHVVTSICVMYVFLILVIYFQSSLLEDTVLRTVVTSDTLYNFFYAKLKVMLFRDEELWCSPERGGDEFVEQVWANVFLPVIFHWITEES